MNSRRLKGLWDLSDRDKIKEEQVSMKKNQRKLRQVGFIAGILLCAGINVFPASAAGRIQKISLYLEGEAAKPGQFLDDTLPEITTSAEKYTIHSYDYVNDRVRWDRMDTPELMIDLYYDSGYKLSKETVEKIQLRGLECTYEKCEWLRKDDLEEDGVRGVRIYLKFPAFSTPGESAKAKQEAIEVKAAELEKKSKKKAKRLRDTSVANGWYQDANGWWYLEDDGKWHTNEWKQTGGSWSYLDADGYAKTGWFEVGGIWYCADKNGTLYVNTVTPDGYHVNGDGAWVS